MSRTGWERAFAATQQPASSPPPPTVQLEEAQHLMRSYEYIVPVDTRSAQRLTEAHTYSTPVVRELPRPIPQGLVGTAW